MKITRVDLTPVSVPFREPEIWFWGERHGISSVILEVHTDTGLVGLGEAVGAPSAPIMLEILRQCVPLVEGSDPFRIEDCTRRLYACGGWHYFRRLGNYAIAAIDMALWDIVGQAAGQPVSRLLGGSVVDRVPFYYPVVRAEPTAMARDAATAVARGMRTVYLKIGLDESADLAIVAAVHEAVGARAKLRVDANEAWTTSEAIRIIRSLEPFHLEFVEQPVAMHDLDALRRVRDAVSVPVAADQAAWLETDVVELVARRAADVVVTGPHRVGGLLALKRMCGLCETAGIPVVKQSPGDLGIATAAGLQVVCTCPNAVRLASQTHLSQLTHDIVLPSHVFAGEALPVPTAPGLGVSLDPERFAEARERYRQTGPFLSFGTPLQAPSPH
jgi:L-alanine-DL-glutamate epimerase-like enolase superfamily enzyme